MRAPDFEQRSILSALLERYGLEGDLAVLLGERDQNLRLTTSNGQKYVVKIAPSGESRLEADFQVSALRHLEQCSISLGLPRVVPTRDGSYATKINGNRLRVLTWVDGGELRRDALTPAVVASLGRSLAVLGRALRDFDHVGKARALDWDLQRALRLRQHTRLIDDAAIRSAVDAVFDEFESDGLPRFAGLRRQVIHNDANPENVMFDSQTQAVTGFIDFADMVEAPLIADIAIAGSYLRDTSAPSRLLAPFVTAYHEVTPLTADEIDLLHLLLRTRLATTLTMAHWRMAALGSEDEYLQQSLQEVGEAGRFLRVLGGIDRGEFGRSLLSP